MTTSYERLNQALLEFQAGEILAKHVEMLRLFNGLRINGADAVPTAKIAAVKSMFVLLRFNPLLTTLAAIEASEHTLLLPNGSLIEKSQSTIPTDRILSGAQVARLIQMYYGVREKQLMLEASAAQQANQQDIQEKKNNKGYLMACGCLLFIGSSAACCSAAALAIVAQQFVR